MTSVMNLIDSDGLGSSAAATACVGNPEQGLGNGRALGAWESPTQFRNKGPPWTSLGVQWLGICLPVQGAQVLSLVWEDSVCCRATGPGHHNY